MGAPNATMKNIFVLCLIGMLFAGCRHAEPAPESAPLWQRSVSISKASGLRMGIHPDKHRIIAADCTSLVFRQRSDSASWYLALGGRPVGCEEGQPSLFGVGPRGDLELYPVIYVDEHELVMSAGPSIAGRLRLKQMMPNKAIPNERHTCLFAIRSGPGCRSSVIFVVRSRPMAIGYSYVMRPLRYSINVTLDGCCDHRKAVQQLKRESGKGLFTGVRLWGNGAAV